MRPRRTSVSVASTMLAAVTLGSILMPFLVTAPDGHVVVGTVPAVAIDLVSTLPGYREGGIATASEVHPGTREEQLAALRARISVLDLAALCAIALTHAPIAAVWLGGWRVA